MTALGVMTVLVNGAFVLACVAALRLWWRHRSRSAAWLAATFAALAVVVLASVVVGEAEEDSVAVRLLVVLLLASPYLLFRFADSIVPAPRVVRRGADGLAVVVLVTTIGLPTFPDIESGGSLGLVGTTYLVLTLVAWAAWGLGAGWLLWRASVGEPSVVRNRLRLLAVAAVGLGVIIPVITLAVEDGDVAAEVVAQGFSAALGLLFLVGFAPPASLRAAWRHDDVRRLHEAAVSFMTSSGPDEIATVLVPGVRRLLGADSVTVYGTAGQVLAHDQEGGTRRTSGESTTIRRRIGDRELEVSVSATVPLFGDDEEDQLDRLSLLAQLAFDRARLLQAERAARADLERANAELESFVHTTSHDLKNPVLAILGYLDVIREDHADELSDDLRHHLDRVAVNTGHMESLIRDLLELSRVGRVDVQPDAVDLGRLVDDVVTDLSAAHPGLRVVVGALPTVWMNPTRVRQLVTNLLDNAARYAGRDDVTVTVEADTTPGGTTIHVRDDGRGIPEEQLERVFGVFERLDAEAPGGTGMGLAICRRVVETAGGRMRAEPSDGGASLVIDLPASAVAPAGRSDGEETPTLEGSPP